MCMFVGVCRWGVCGGGVGWVGWWVVWLVCGCIVLRLCNKEFDVIHLGLFDKGIVSNSIADFPTGYRMINGDIDSSVLQYHKNHTIKTPFIEDITNEKEPFRVIRKFNTRCTDSFLWKYSGIVKFLNFMRNFEDYSCPFDYYMCNFFEKNLNFKHYWSVNEFFKQGSNLGLMESTLKN